MYAFKASLYEFLHGVHRTRLAGRMHMEPSTLSRAVKSNTRVLQADLDRLIGAVQTSERTPPTPSEIAHLRRLHVRAEREVDPQGFELCGLRADRDQAVRRAAALEELLDSARTELARLRAGTEQALQDDGEPTSGSADRLAELEARVQQLERALAGAVADIVALEERLVILERNLDLDAPAGVPALADDPLRAAQVLAAITDESERIATAGRLVPALSVPAGVLVFLAELLHRVRTEALLIVAESLSAMPVGDLAAVVVAADIDDVGSEDGGQDEGDVHTNVQMLLHDLVHTRLRAPAFAALIHLLMADDQPVLAGRLLAGGAQGPVHHVLDVSAALHGHTARYLLQAAMARSPEGIAELAAALRTKDRDADARTVLHAAGRQLRNRELARLEDLLRASGRAHDLRELQEGAARRATAG
jgi:hypothetical protein